MRKAWVLAISLLTVLVLLIGMGVGACGGEDGETIAPSGEEEEEELTPGPPAPGEWFVSIDIGELRFTVSPDSTGISEFSLYIPGEFKCGISTWTDSLHRKEFPSLWLITDGRFTAEPTRAPRHLHIVIQGEFDETGTRASGTWEISSEAGTICAEGTWEASR